MRPSSIRMQPGWPPLIAAAAMGIVLFPACGAEESPSPRSAATYEEEQLAAAARERDEFIDDTQARIVEIDGEVARLEEQVDRESEFVSEADRSEWKEQLFGLRRERQEAQARLDRARTATPGEWQASRDDVTLQMNRLEADIQALNDAITRAYSGEPEEEREPVRGEDEFGPVYPYEEMPEGVPPEEGMPPEEEMPPGGVPPGEFPPEDFHPEW